MPGPDTEVLIYRLRQQEPTKDVTDQAVVTKRGVGKGAIVGIHGPIFRDYVLGHYPLLREFIGVLVKNLGIPWEVTVDAPPHLEQIVRVKNGKLLVNLINRGAGETFSPSRSVLEELPPIENVTVHIRRARRPKFVRVVPNDSNIMWSYAKGSVTVKVPRVAIHQVVVVE